MHCEGLQAPSNWDSLDNNLQLSILTLLIQQRDQQSLQALLQSSRGLRLLVSSLIRAIEIRAIDALERFPRHATAITSVQLVIVSSARGRMEPSRALTFLAAARLLATCGRLALATHVQLELPLELEEHTAPSMDVLMESLGHACPMLRSLVVNQLHRDDEYATVAFFRGLGRALPGLVELEVAIHDDSSDYDLDIAGIDWAACLPPGLRKLHLPATHLHHELLDHLVQMPGLEDVAALSLSIMRERLGAERTLRSEACTWRALKLVLLPNFQRVCSFTAWPAGMQLAQLKRLSGDGPLCWKLIPLLGYAARQHQVQAVAAAAARLATCSCRDLAWHGRTFSIGWFRNWDTEDVFLPEPADAAGVISALAPLANKIPTLCLKNWEVTAELLDEIALALPQTHGLLLKSCFVDSGAWTRLLSLSSVTELGFSGEHPLREQVTLLEATSFALSVPRAMTLWFGGDRGDVMSDIDQAEWDSFVLSLPTRRRDSGLPPITISRVP